MNENLISKSSSFANELVEENFHEIVFFLPTNCIHFLFAIVMC